MIKQDLSKLGRDLSKCIIIDNVCDNFQLQTENGILIKSWFEDPDDRALAELNPLLLEIASSKIPDVRVALKKLKEKMGLQINGNIAYTKLTLF